MAVYLAPVLLALGCDTSSFFLPPGTSRPAGRDFATATVLEFDDHGNTSITGNVAINVIDIWDAGPVSPGDHIVVDVRTAFGSAVDPTTAIFDGNQDLFAVNDDADPDVGNFDSHIDQIVHLATPHFYIAITASYFTTASGQYVGEVHIGRENDPPHTAPQKLLLNFSGGMDVDIENVDTFDIVPFDAALIDPDYAGHTDEIRQKIVDTVRARFANFNVIVLDSEEEPSLPAEGDDYSTLYFGRFSRVAFGISESVDTWDQNICDDGIIFIEQFDDPFAVKPSVEGIGLAIGQVAAHEAGHLIGLSHVRDPSDLMDATGSASTLLATQHFKRSELDRPIFPIGFQDGPKTLEATVGAAP